MSSLLDARFSLKLLIILGRIPVQFNKEKKQFQQSYFSVIYFAILNCGFGICFVIFLLSRIQLEWPSSDNTKIAWIGSNLQLIFFIISFCINEICMLSQRKSHTKFLNKLLIAENNLKIYNDTLKSNVKMDFRSSIQLGFGLNVIVFVLAFYCGMVFWRDSNITINLFFSHIMYGLMFFLPYMDMDYAKFLAAILTVNLNQINLLLKNISTCGDDGKILINLLRGLDEFLKLKEKYQQVFGFVLFLYTIAHIIFTTVLLFFILIFINNSKIYTAKLIIVLVLIVLLMLIKSVFFVFIMDQIGEQVIVYILCFSY